MNANASSIASLTSSNAALLSNYYSLANVLMGSTAAGSNASLLSAFFSAASAVNKANIDDVALGSPYYDTQSMAAWDEAYALALAYQNTSLAYSAASDFGAATKGSGAYCFSASAQSYATAGNSLMASLYYSLASSAASLSVEIRSVADSVSADKKDLFLASSAALAAQSSAGIQTRNASSYSSAASVASSNAANDAVVMSAASNEASSYIAAQNSYTVVQSSNMGNKSLAASAGSSMALAMNGDPTKIVNAVY